MSNYDLPAQTGSRYDLPASLASTPSNPQIPTPSSDGNVFTKVGDFVSSILPGLRVAVGKFTGEDTAPYQQLLSQKQFQTTHPNQVVTGTDESGNVMSRPATQQEQLSHLNDFVMGTVGGEDVVNNLESLVAEKSPTAIKSILQEHFPNLSPKFVDEAAPKLANAKTPQEVGDILKPELQRLAATKSEDLGNLSQEQTPKASEESTIPEQSSTAQIGQNEEAQPGKMPEIVPQEGELKASSLDTGVAKDFNYVKNEPLNIDVLKDDKTTAGNIRAEYTGVKNEQIVRGNQLADEIRTLVPEKVDREGMFWYRAANGDRAVLEEALKNPKLAQYHPQIERALNLPENAIKALDKGEQYYKEAGAVSQEIGTIKNLREDYQNRIYEPEPSKDFVKNEMGQNLKLTTGHAKSRVFDTEFQAVEVGKKFATTDYADALAIHNEEMARVNTARKLADTLSDQSVGLGKWTESVPRGWSQVGNLRKGAEVFAAPRGIADGLKAIADPDFIKRVDEIRGIQKYQGFVKSIDLSFSLFHHLTFLTQTLMSKDGFSVLMNLPRMFKVLDNPEFLEMEKDFVRNTGITSKVAANQDIIAHLTRGDDFLARLSKVPVVKQIFGLIEKSNQFLFGDMQRFLKVMEYQKNVANWIGKHGVVSDAELTAAKRGFAKGINAEFGGLNWESLGFTKSVQSVLRTILLAPDWFVSSASQAKYAFSRGTEGQVARSTLFKAIAGGMVMTEALNKMFTGHYTDQNPKGHHMEVEVAPNVYVSLIRGAPGELVKFLSNVTESGLQGVSRYLEGKLSPIARTGLVSLSGVDYTGRSIYSGKNPVSKSFHGLLAILNNLMPVPFGVSTLTQYLSSGKVTPVGLGAITTGVGRFSIGSGAKKKTSSRYSY